MPSPSSLGSPRQVSLRELFNAIKYVLDNDIKWRAMLPKAKIIDENGTIYGS